MFVGNVLTRQASGDLGPNRVVERPHVIFNAATATNVMYMHIDNTTYSERRAGVATSPSVCGQYTYRGSCKPTGHDSLDDTLFLRGRQARRSGVGLAILPGSLSPSTATCSATAVLHGSRGLTEDLVVSQSSLRGASR
ncbi:hypothetical protein ABT369_56325 [Dactylosporangium sp. NPDC000244]|uniref:hypothetical protein n=1 Tax=Dactylosporangium sp. NPDC000244 TaxID=3154365 RepID=UPI0033260459